MQTKNQTPIVRKIFYVIMLLGVFLSAFGTNNLSIAKASESQQEDEFGYTINSGSYELPEDLISALKLELSDIESESGNATIYGVGYFEEHSNWSWINLVVANGKYYNNDEVGPMFLYFATKLNEDWTVVLSSNDTEYKSTLDQISREGLTDEEINLLNDYYSLNRNEPVPDINALAGNLLFPWPSTQNSWHTGSLGFHAAGFSSLGVESGALAIDMIPPSPVSSATIIAMESGAIVNKLECTWNTVLIIRHDGYPDSKKFVYLHIQNGTTPGIGSINRGSNLGTLRYPTMNGTCSGYACEIDYNPATGNICSQSTARHLHLGIGTDTSIVIDGRVASTLLGTSLTSSNSTGGGGGGTGQGCDQVSYNGVRLYENANCNRDTNGGSKSFSSSTGLTDIVSDFNDIASSIYVGSGWSVKVFEKSVGEGGGSWRCMTGSMWDLNVDYYTNGDVNRKINDDISSVQIYNNNNCGGGGGTSASWNARYFNGQDHWWDNNNFNNQMCEETINTTGLDKNYGTSAPCGNGVSDNWVAEYNSTVYFPAGSYVFYAQNDDGLKIWVNGSNIMERGGSSGYYPRCPALNLNGNTPIRAILREEGGDARVKIAWSTETSVCIPPGSFDKSSPINGATGVSTSPTLIWGSSSNSAGYNYCIDTSNNNNCDTGWQSVGSLTSKSLSGLTAGTTYYWQARSNNEGGEVFANGGTWWSFTTQPNVPNIPQNLRINGSTSNSITMTWDDVSNETGYKIFQWEGAQGFVYLATVGANQTTYTETRANCGWDEYYTVSAYNGNGESQQSVWVQGFTLACSLPGAFNKTGPSNNSTNQSTSPSLAWGSSSGATSYEYCIDISNDNNCSNWISTNTNTSITLSNLPSNTTHYWHVRSKNSNNDITYSNGNSSTAFWSFTTQNTSPTDDNYEENDTINTAYDLSTWEQIWLSAINGYGKQVDVDWYKIYVTPNYNRVSVDVLFTHNQGDVDIALYDNSGVQLAISNGVVDNEYIDFIVSPNGGYYYIKVYYGNQGNQYDLVWDDVQPPAIDKSAPTDFATSVSLTPTLSWSTVSGATSYEYCYSSAPSPCSAWFSAGSNTTKTLSGLAPNYTYYWQARAVTPSGNIEANGGTWWSFTTVNTPACSWNPYTPPSSPTFNDVPMNVPHWSWVQRLYNGGITAGCGNGNFCPGDAVNRASMAIFLLRGKYCGNTYTPPAVGGSTGFNDVATNVTYAPWVKQLAADGVTAGCGNSNFCPGNAVNRASMAIFLLRAKHGGTYSPPGVAGISGFNDVPADTSYAPWVKQLADEGVTAGCGNGNFCPADTVNRAQMAIFLVRAFGLP